MRLIADDGADVCTDCEVVGNVYVEVCSDSILVVVLVKILVVTVLSTCTERKEITELVCSAGCLDACTCLKSIRLHCLLDPVCIRIENRI